MNTDKTDTLPTDSRDRAQHSVQQIRAKNKCIWLNAVLLHIHETANLNNVYLQLSTSCRNLRFVLQSRMIKNG
jgi:hypothetical protein